ncbi:flavin reductase [Clostridium diolis]|uniref:flavin reductase family protein n=1 Tax=Clostridium diolis TaxID=223919 RepID=UPI000B3F9A61|nr:flavin reductase family protein [Clostridium diolis]OVE68917.1 flavin reductase [Clostridium diolis]
MEKINVNYEKMYYGFPVILISFFDKNGLPNVTTLSSSYSLKDMVVLGFSSKGYAINQIKEVRDFVINIPDSSLRKEISFCGTKSGHEVQKFDATELTYSKSKIVNAPIIEECPITIECTLTDVIEKDAYAGITNILGIIKGRLISKEYLDDENRLNISKFDNLLYFGDGINKGYRYIKNEQ